MRKPFRNIALTIALGLAALPAAAKSIENLTPIERQVRHELVTMPYYGVFDNLNFQVDGDRVILSGQTVRPTIKTSAERRVAQLEAITEVENRIEVLPVSGYDDSLRVRVARALYTHPVLDRYALRAVPSIHIIVKNGRVTLEGVVNREAEKNVAFIQANGVSGVFEVTNNLRVEIPNKT